MKERVVYRVITILIALLLIIGTFLGTALYTNWFRYELSLEGLAALLLFLAINAPLAGAVLFLFFASEDTRIQRLRIYIFVLFILSGFCFYYSFQSLPQFYFDDIENSKTYESKFAGKSIRFFIESKNQFSSFREVYLHLDDERGTQTVIKLPIKDSVDIGEYTAPYPWTKLEKETGDKFKFTLYSSLYTYIFNIDLVEKTAVLVETRQTKTEGCYDKESDTWYVCVSGLGPSE